MRGGITAALDAALGSRVVSPVLLFRLDHPAGVLRLWTGVGTLRWDGAPWTGAGTLLSCSTAEETTEVQVVTTTYRLAAPDFSPEAEALILMPARRVPMRSWWAFLDQEGACIGALLRSSGYADAPTISDGADGQRLVELAVEGAIYNLTAPLGTGLSDEEQQARFPGDTGLAEMATIQNQQLVWQVGSYNNFSPP